MVAFFTVIEPLPVMQMLELAGISQGDEMTMSFVTL